LAFDDFASDEPDDDDDEDDERRKKRRLSSLLTVTSDCLEAELALRSAPREPHPDRSPQVASLCCRSLQWIDYPTENGWLERCYRFFTTECRKLVKRRKSGVLSGGGRDGRAATEEVSSVQNFYHFAALTPELQTFMGSTRVKVEDVTITPAHPPISEALASFSVVIHDAPVVTIQHRSGMARNGVAPAPPISYMVIRLEEQRRPSHQAC
jgi:hypothetical protein